MTDRLWERLEGETEKQYAMFQSWLNYPTPRAVEKFIRENGFVSRHVYEAKRTHNWTDRTRAYDNFMGKQSDAATSSALSAFRVRVVNDEINDYAMLQATWEKMYAQVMTDEMKIGERVKVMKQLAQMRLTIDAMARKASQMPNTYSGKGDGITNEELTPDFIELTAGGPKYYIAERSEDDETDAAEQH